MSFNLSSDDEILNSQKSDKKEKTTEPLPDTPYKTPTINKTTTMTPATPTTNEEKDILRLRRETLDSLGDLEDLIDEDFEEQLTKQQKEEEQQKKGDNKEKNQQQEEDAEDTEEDEESRRKPPAGTGNGSSDEIYSEWEKLDLTQLSRVTGVSKNKEFGLVVGVVLYVYYVACLWLHCGLRSLFRVDDSSSYIPAHCFHKDLHAARLSLDFYQSKRRFVDDKKDV